MSSLLLRAIDLEGYLAAAEEGDFQSIISYMSEHIAGWVLYGIFLLFVIGMLVTGLVLFIVFAAKRRFVLEKGRSYCPGGSEPIWCWPIPVCWFSGCTGSYRSCCSLWNNVLLHGRGRWNGGKEPGRERECILLMAESDTVR